MRKKIIVFISMLLLTMCLPQMGFINHGLKAQSNDSFFYSMETARSGDPNSSGFDRSSLSNTYGLNFNGFNSNGVQGVQFGNLEHTSNNTPLGSGLAVLSVLSLLYIGRKKEDRGS